MGHKIAMLRKQYQAASQIKLPQKEVNNAFEKLLDKSDTNTPIQNVEVKRQAQTESMSSDHRDIDDESHITAAAAAVQEKNVCKDVPKEEEEKVAKPGKKVVNKCEHTESKHHCKGMCKPCYTKSMNKRLKEKKL